MIKKIYYAEVIFLYIYSLIYIVMYIDFGWYDGVVIIEPIFILLAIPVILNKFFTKMLKARSNKWKMVYKYISNIISIIAILLLFAFLVNLCFNENIRNIFDSYLKFMCSDHF